MWIEWFQSLSEESIRYRFFQMLKDTPHEVRVRYCNIDYDREVAMVAEIVENGKRKILGVTRLSIESDAKHGEMAFIVSDYWQGLGLGTKLVDYTLDIAKEKGIENVYAIMLQDNYRALSLTKKMGFAIEYLSDGTVKGTLDLKSEDIDFRCIQRNLPEPPKEKAEAKARQEEPPIIEAKPLVRETREASSS
jgi:acetyltransferase